MNTESLLRVVVEKADEFKGENLRILKVAEHCSFADYFVVMSGQSSLQIRALAEAVILQVKQHGILPLNVEGMTESTWCLLDFGDIIVHIFNEEKRRFFGLESFWSHVEEIPRDQVGLET